MPALHNYKQYRTLLFRLTTYDQYAVDDFTSRPSSKSGYPFGEFQYINKDRATIRNAEVKGELFLDTLGLAKGWHARSI